MSTLPFDVKTGAANLVDDPIYGFVGLHFDARDLLMELCAFVEREQLPRLLITEFGRKRDDQERLYTPTYVAEGHPLAQAQLIARNQFSWHCVALPLRMCRAFDVRVVHGVNKDDQAIAKVYSDTECSNLISRALSWGVEHKRHVEALHHQVKGSAEHLHFAVRDPIGHPADWL